MSLFAAASGEGGDNMSWSKGVTLFNMSSPLSDLLESNDFTLEQLLEEDELIQEVKYKNGKLIEFLGTKSVVLQMVEYLTVRPTEDASDCRKFKYPYMSCEVFSCDIPQITEILADEDVLEKLFLDFLNCPKVDSRLAGYFEKVVSLLLVRKGKELAEMINKNSATLLQAFTMHLDSYSIAELFKRLLQPLGQDLFNDGMDMGGMGGLNYNAMFSGDMNDFGMTTPKSPEAVPSLVWQESPVAIERLVKCLGLTNEAGEFISSDVHQHVGEILVDIIHASLRGGKHAEDSAVLADFLESQDLITFIINAAIPEDESSVVIDSSVAASLSVLRVILARYSSISYKPEDEEELPLIVSSTIDKIPQISSALKGENFPPGNIRTQCHVERPRLGLNRLRLTGLLVSLVHTKYHAVDAALVQNDVISIVLDLFFQFDLVNMLHSGVESIVNAILEAGSPTLQRGLVVQGKLFERLLEAIQVNEEAENAVKGNRRGNMGHIIRMLNVIQMASEGHGGNAGEKSSEDLESSYKAMTQIDRLVQLFESSPVWSEMSLFLHNELPKLNEHEATELGGGLPAINGAHEEEDHTGYQGYVGQDSMLSTQFADMLASHAELAEEDEEDEEDDGDLLPSRLGAGLIPGPSYHEDSSSSDDDEDFADFHRNKVYDDLEGSDENVVVVDPHSSEVIPPPSPTRPSGDFDDSSQAMEAADEAMAQESGNDEGWANFDSNE